MERGPIAAKGLNANQLKLIAILAMTLDHLTWTLIPGYSTHPAAVALHICGRLTAPIMWFFIVEGYHYTHDIKRYIGRLFALAVVSHFAYDFCFGIPFLPFRQTVFNQTGVVWSLAWGLVTLYVVDKKLLKPWQELLFLVLVCLITFPSDWSCIATLAILYMGLNRGNFKKQMTWMMVFTLFYAAVYFFFIDKLYALIQLFTCLTIPLLRLYNGQRGQCRWMGKVFYAYYPAHLILCGVIRVLLWGVGFSTAAGAL